ncbi:hypothetical protein J6590_044116 [Homalodisca vitripennis]|nr:hypothetical protein J6590_044116 [Homalodisca vitripennis]
MKQVSEISPCGSSELIAAKFCRTNFHPFVEIRCWKIARQENIFHSKVQFTLSLQSERRNVRRPPPSPHPSVYLSSGIAEMNH